MDLKILYQILKYSKISIKWLEDSRVGFTRGNANRYMKIAQELGNVAHHATFDQLSLVV